MSKNKKFPKASKVLPFEYIIIQGEKVKYIQCEDKIVKKNKKALVLRRVLFLRNSLAGRTGLEPATSAVTGQCSNQLNYRPKFYLFHYNKK